MERICSAPLLHAAQALPVPCFSWVMVNEGNTAQQLPDLSCIHWGW